MDEVKDNYIDLPTYKVIFMALSVGVIVANMFYIQPIEPLITSSYHISSSTTAVLAMLVQVSYALGLLFLVPLGDAFNRYKFLQVMELISIIALLVAAIAPNFLDLRFSRDHHRFNIYRSPDYHSLYCLLNSC